MSVVRSLSPIVFLILLIGSLGYVLWRGGKAERGGISAIAIGSVLSALAANSEGPWQHAETGIFVVDVTLLIALMIIMGHSNRFWPLWITAFQIVAVMTHLARFLRPNTIPIAYAIAEELWALPMQAILVAVVCRDRRTKLLNKSLR